MANQTTSRFLATAQFAPNSWTRASRVVLGLAALLTWTAGAAHAASVTADYTGAAPSLIIEYTLQDVPGLSQPLTHHLTLAGQLNWSKVSGGPGLSGNFVSFCIELNQEITPKPGFNQFTYDMVSLENGSQPGIGTGGPGNNGPLGTTNADEIRQLWGMHISDVVDDVTAAAFQITIWEIIYGPWFTPFAHNIPGHPEIAADGAAAIALAGTWLTDVQTPDPQLYENGLVALTSATAQDQVVLLAPAPGGFMLAGVGLLTLLGYRRRASK